jgi:hypothetical protein
MREIMTGQGIGFLIQEKDRTLFTNSQDREKKITLASILALVSKNQGEQRGVDLFFNLRLLLQNLLEKQFFAYFDNKDNTLDNCWALYEEMQDFFIENCLDDPLDTLKQRLGTVTMQYAVKATLDAFLEKVGPIFAKPIAQNALSVGIIKTEFARLVDYSKLPATVKMGEANDAILDVELDASASNQEVADSSVSADKNQNSEASEADKDSHQQKETLSALPSVPFTPQTELLPSAPYESLGLDPKSLASLNFEPDFALLLEGLYGSTNYFRMDEEGKRPKGIVKTAYLYLLIEEAGRFKVVLMDDEDAQATAVKMQQDSAAVTDPTRNFYLLSSLGDVIISNAQKPLDKAAWEADSKFQILSKLFTRQWQFAPKEIEYLAKLGSSVRANYFQFINEEIVYALPPAAGDMAKLEHRVKNKIAQHAVTDLGLFEKAGSFKKPENIRPSLQA